jgi:CRP-like cAMP-binding protein
LTVSAIPILVLHALLFPLNVCRLAQNFRLKKRVQSASDSDAGKLLILPYMNRLSLPAGAVIFRKDEPSDQIYYVIEGMVELIEQCETRGHGELMGLLGVFNLGGVRLDTAISSTPVHLGAMSVADVERALLHDAALNRFLLKILAKKSYKNALRSSGGHVPNGFLAQMADTESRSAMAQ